MHPLPRATGANSRNSFAKMEIKTSKLNFAVFVVNSLQKRHNLLQQKHFSNLKVTFGKKYLNDEGASLLLIKAVYSFESERTSKKELVLLKLRLQQVKLDSFKNPTFHSRKSKIT